MSKKPTSPETLYGTGRDYLREQIKTNEILADIAGVEYTPPEGVPKGKYMENKWLLDVAEKKNELLEEIAEGGPGGGSAAAKAIGIDYATDGIFLKNKNGDTIQGSGATLPAYGVTFDPATGGLTLTKNGTAVQGQTVTIPNYGSPVGVDASADMTDHDQIYLYLGTTGGGLTNGHFYYWDGAAWADGGEYAAATVQTDKTLLVEDRAADAKATGDAINSVKTQVNTYEAEYADFSMKVLNSYTLQNDFIYGRYVESGFNDSVTTYARNNVAYPAGRYEIGPYAAKGFKPFQYVSDTEGTALLDAWYTSKVTINPTGPWYITFNAITGDADITAINAGMTVKRITTEEATLETQIQNVSDSSTETSEVVDDITKELYSKNRYDGTYISGGGYIVPTTGDIGVNASYSPTDFIDISNHGTQDVVLSSHFSYDGYGVRYAFYDATKTYINNAGAAIASADISYDAGLNRFYSTLPTPNNAVYIRFSTFTSFFEQDNVTFQIEYNLPSPYEPYSANRFVLTGTSLDDSTIASMTYGRSPTQAKAASLTTGQTIVAESNSIVKNQSITFFAKITTFDKVLVGHGQVANGYYVKVDDTNLTYMSNGNAGTAVPHGLTISDFIFVNIQITSDLHFNVTILTAGGSYNRSASIYASFAGEVFAKSDGSTFTDACITWSCEDYKKALWAFGDSYFTIYSTSRWTHVVVDELGYDTALYNAYPGEKSSAAYTDLATALVHGKPKYILWCVGMNDPDTTEVNPSWYYTAKALESVCADNGIELIYATIPQVTDASYNNTYKNQYITGSGYRYVDFAGAVDGVTGWLSNDGVHPNELGARLLASEALSDCPELFQTC